MQLTRLPTPVRCKDLFLYLYTLDLQGED